MDDTERFRAAATGAAAAGTLSPTEAREVHGLAVAAGIGTVVLVEGVSDRVAVEMLAERLCRDLSAEGACVLDMGGAMSIRRYLQVLAGNGSELRLAGLCDANEAPFFRRGLEEAGYGRDLDDDAMTALGFHVCTLDLEDELIRCLGVGTVCEVIASAGHARKLRTFQDQPAQRDRTVAQQLRRFMGTTSGRKEQYARLLIERLDLAHIPAPLSRLLAAL